MTSETYPSGRVINTSYDGANRPAQVTGTMAGAQTAYLGQISYAPHGAPAGYRYGNTLTRQATFNNRLQPASTIDMVNGNPGNQLLALSWNWGTTNNNGNLQGISEYNGGPGYPNFLQFNQSFSYDNVNRLTGASDSGDGRAAFNTIHTATCGSVRMPERRWLAIRLLRMSTPEVTGWRGRATMERGTRQW